MKLPLRRNPVEPTLAAAVLPMAPTAAAVGEASLQALAGAAVLLGTLVGVLVFTAAFTLVERKTMALLQRREGPDRVGFEGLGQPFADGLKVVRKETAVPKDSPAHRLFFLAPVLSLWISLSLWALMPWGPAGALCNSEVGLLVVLGLGSLGSYGVIYAGWASNNKYALMGALRAVAQFISYEIVFAVALLPLVGAAGSTSLVTLVLHQELHGWFAYLVPLWALTFVLLLAEANRTPFDLPEAEAELVSGFNVEYSALLFAFFFLAEYGSMGFFSALFASLFFGGWSSAPLGRGVHSRGGTCGGLETLVLSWRASPLVSGSRAISADEAATLSRILERRSARSSAATLEVITEAGISFGGYIGYVLLPLLVLVLKTQLVCGAFVLARAALPRKRFDQLIALCWKLLFPLGFALALSALGVLYGMVLTQLWLDSFAPGELVAKPTALRVVKLQPASDTPSEGQDYCDLYFGNELYGTFEGNLEAMVEKWLGRARFEVRMTPKQMAQCMMMHLDWELKLAVREGKLTAAQFVAGLEQGMGGDDIPEEAAREAEIEASTAAKSSLKSTV